MPETMTTPGTPMFAVKKSANTKPFSFGFFMVQGINFRCVAYRDQQGRWRDAQKQDELFGDIQILE
jgi:hypothetical protein